MAIDVNQPTNEQLMREVNMLRARVEYPLADQDILNLINGTPDQIKSAAQKLHEQALKAQPPAAPAPPAAPPAPVPVATQPVLQPTPGPAPVPGPGQGAPPEQVEDARYLDLRYKVENRIAEPHERQQFFDLALRKGWNDQVEQMNGRHAK